MKIAEEFSDSKYATSHKLGIESLYQIATLPESARTESHTIPSSGEEKKPEDMTVKELREVKRQLKQFSEGADLHHRELS